jgi:hypothetical protein
VSIPIIGFNGFKGAGKDTAARGVAQRLADYGYFAARRGFADKMKIAGMRSIFGDQYSDAEMIAAANDLKGRGGGVTVNFPSWRGGTTYAIEGRTFWQQFGTEALRDTYGSDFHVNALLPLHCDWPANFKTTDYPDVDVALVCDVRFTNEAQRILDLGGEVWEIVRPGLSGDGHASEVPLPRELVTKTVMNRAGSAHIFMDTTITPLAEQWAREHDLPVLDARLPYRLPDR